MPGCKGRSPDLRELSEIVGPPSGVKSDAMALAPA